MEDVFHFLSWASERCVCVTFSSAHILYYLEEIGVLWNCKMPFEFFPDLEVFIIVNSCFDFGQLISWMHSYEQCTSSVAYMCWCVVHVVLTNKHYTSLEQEILPIMTITTKMPRDGRATKPCASRLNKRQRRRSVKWGIFLYMCTLMGLNLFLEHPVMAVV